MFADVLNEEQVEGLARSCPATRVAGDTVIIRQGESTASMFVILEGAARVSVTGSDGAAHNVAVLASGDVVGEMSLMTGAPRTATVTAVTPLRVLEITKAAIEALVASSPGLIERFGHVLAERQLELSELAALRERKEEVELDLLNRMRVFFARAFGA
jgi:CRP-like cAMP-binding protein